MERQFQLILTNRWKAIGFVFAVVIILCLLFALAALVLTQYPIMGFIGALLALGGWIFMLEYIGRRVAFETAVATINETGLTVCNSTTGTLQQIRFAEMASYSTDGDFTVRPHDGDRLVLHYNYKMHPQGMEAKWKFEQHFQWAVTDYQQRHPDQLPIRNLGFLDRRGAIVLLLILASLLAWLGWWSFQPLAGGERWGGFLLGSLLFALYALVWHHHRNENCT